MPLSLTRIVALVAASIILASVVWMVHRTVERARDSSARALHTQAVLDAAESVLSSALDAEAAALAFARTGEATAIDAFDRAARATASNLEHLADLSRGDVAQTQRIQALRRETARALTTLTGLIDERRSGRGAVAGRGDAPFAMEPVRSTLRAMRLEEGRLTAQRRGDDQAAFERLAWMSAAFATIAALLIAWLVVVVSRDAVRQRRGADVLRETNVRLETEVEHRATDLRDSNARLRSIIDSAVDGIIVMDADARIEAFSRGAERLFGYAEPDVIGCSVNVLMPPPEGHDTDVAQYLSSDAARIVGSGREVTGRRRDGSAFPLHLSVGEMAIDGQRKFTGMLHDLSERVRLEERLRASEARWRAVVESAVDGVVVIDAQGAIEAFNPAAERLFGYAEEEVLGRNVRILMPSPYREEHDSYLARYLATGTQKIIGIGRAVTGLHRDGRTFPVHLSVGEITVDGQRRFTGILHDLSARVKMEEQLREQSGLARVGEMAAVIAHEVKNPLAGVRGAIQVIGSRLPPGSPDSAVVKEVVSRIDALNELMKDLLLFARPPQPRPTPVDLRALAATTAGLLAQDPAWNGVHVDVEGSASPIFADAEMLKIVFQNLMVNSAHAMHGQGRILVGVTNADGASRITVTDEGPGIPREIREKIFTPFFTTKSRGSGLGLATAKRLIDAHRGRIDVECPPTGGTVITIELPIRTA